MMSDYIKREDAIKAITMSYDEVLSVGDAIETLDSLPPVDVVERKKGEWIHDWESCWSTCSACGEGYLWEDNDGVGEWNFCPNCGADMRKGPN